MTRTTHRFHTDKGTIERQECYWPEDNTIEYRTLVHGKLDMVFEEDHRANSIDRFLELTEAYETLGEI